MAKNKDYYLILGVPRDETTEGIRRAFCRLAKASHPDRSRSRKADAFHQAAEAYEVLSDPEKRRRYDDSLGAAGAARPSTAARVRVTRARSPVTEPPVTGFRRAVRFYAEPEPLIPPRFYAQPEPLIPPRFGTGSPVIGRHRYPQAPRRSRSSDPASLLLHFLLRTLSIRRL